MMITIQAPIKKVGPLETVGAQGQYQKRMLILAKPWQSQDGSKSGENLYPIEFFGDAVNNIGSNLSEGEEVSVQCRVDGKEWQGRYFVALKAVGEISYIARANSGVGEESKPSAFQSADPAANPSVSEAEEDDLPF